MSKQSKKGLIGLVAGLALMAIMLLGMHGCSDRQPVQPGATVCPPGATFCPSPVAADVEGGAFGVPESTGAVLGTLAAPVRNAKVMVCDDKQSDPRVIVMDVPAGTVLMKEAEER